MKKYMEKFTKKEVKKSEIDGEEILESVLKEEQKKVKVVNEKIEEVRHVEPETRKESLNTIDELEAREIAEISMIMDDEMEELAHIEPEIPKQNPTGKIN
jgi:hypothetical protein